ncbi:hypothetical protein QYE76_005377 [Lolium multiflorum]|uniref:Uncharacterized protein n=1 Tax=Lolium multiflorum TaxID=4521 RepID=A0AAD8RUQ1_LOLMU|nr:hypothetical protein QYE76_005377 [Lolium multiflorum]
MAPLFAEFGGAVATPPQRPPGPRPSRGTALSPFAISGDPSGQRDFPLNSCTSLAPTVMYPIITKDVILLAFQGSSAGSPWLQSWKAKVAALLKVCITAAASAAQAAELVPERPTTCSIKATMAGRLAADVATPRSNAAKDWQQHRSPMAGAHRTPMAATPDAQGSGGRQLEACCHRLHQLPASIVATATATCSSRRRR